MNSFTKFTIAMILAIMLHTNSYAQFSGIKGKILEVGAAMGAKKLGLDELIKRPAAVTTSFNDVNQIGSKLPDLIEVKNAQPLYLLPRSPEGGYVLCEGFFEMTSKSYCLHAGTFAPSEGDGYMYAALAGPKSGIITTIIKSAAAHPEIEQKDIQVFLWTIIARTRFADYSGKVKITATALLNPTQLTQLEGGVLGVLPNSIVKKAKAKLPTAVQAAFEAENNIRQLVASGNYTYAQMEEYAIVAGMAAPRPDIPSGIWTLHPDGYYIRYFPFGFSRTRVQIYVPAAVIAAGTALVYDAADDIACPANTGSQRLLQTNEPIGADYSIQLKNNCN
jgi:hypothetical protein